MKCYNGRPEARLFCGTIYYMECTLASENKDSTVELTSVQSLTSQPLPLWVVQPDLDGWLRVIVDSPNHTPHGALWVLIWNGKVLCGTPFLWWVLESLLYEIRSSILGCLSNQPTIADIT